MNLLTETVIRYKEYPMWRYSLHEAHGFYTWRADYITTMILKHDNAMYMVYIVWECSVRFIKSLWLVTLYDVTELDLISKINNEVYKNPPYWTIALMILMISIWKGSFKITHWEFMGLKSRKPTSHQYIHFCRSNAHGRYINLQSAQAHQAQSSPSRRSSAKSRQPGV